MNAEPIGNAGFGLIAGAGRFPIVYAENARRAGIPVACVGLAGMADPVLKELCTSFVWLRRFAIGKAIRTFQKAGVRQWTMAGKYHKTVLYRPWRWLYLMPDYRTIRVWYQSQRKDNRDDSLLLSLIEEFRSEGLECRSALELCPELLVKAGTLTSREPSQSEWADIKFGWTIAKEMGRLDIGQSVMIRELTVIAVEAIEGTDEAIRRAGQLTRRGFVVVKVAKPQQDMRFDVPTVGVQTIETMKQAGAKVLAIEAGRTILLDQDATIQCANRHAIAIVACEPAKLIE